VQQAADVLTDLRNVLDDEQADLIDGGHRADYTKPTMRADAYPLVMGRAVERGPRGWPPGPSPRGLRCPSRRRRPGAAGRVAPRSGSAGRALGRLRPTDCHRAPSG